MKQMSYYFSLLLLLALPVIVSGQTPEQTADTQQVTVREDVAVQKVFPTMNIEMEVYPNPAREKIYLRIDAPAFKLVWLTLYNCNGQVLRNRQVQIPANLEMNLQELSPGVYLLRVTDGKEVLTKRVLRQR